MQVEVNAENIVKYNLVQLTGNSAEDLLQLAKEAAESDPSFILVCRVPDLEDDVIHMNVFDAVEGRTPTEEEIAAFYHEASPITTYKKKDNQPSGRVINVEFEGTVVDGEVVESHIEEEEPYDPHGNQKHRFYEEN